VKLKISTWAIDHPTPVILLFLLLSLAGLLAYWKLPIAGNPRVDLPIIAVGVSQPGASSNELETNVARRLEDAVAGIAGVKHLTTTISNGDVQLVAEFQLDADTDRAASDVRDAVALVRPELPQSIGEPVVTRVDVTGGALQRYMLRSDTLDNAELSRLVDEDVGPKLLGVKGVQQVKRVGGTVRELRLELDPARMAAAGLTVAEVLAQLRGLETNLPAGAASNAAGQQLPVRVMGASANAEQLARRPLSLADGRSITLGELGRIVDVASEPRGYALLDGEPGVALEIFKKRGSSEIALADAVAKMLNDIEAAQPGLHFELFHDGVQATRLSFAGARDMLLEGALLTVLVIWFFLRNARATGIAAAAIPLSLLPTFLVMHLKGFQLDAVTLLALILVIGILVDDAIVEIENIERRIQAGDAPRVAASVGADSLGLAVIAITATIVAVFLPVSFIGGVVGKYFTEFGLTTTFAVISSLVVARLVTPMMCAWWLKPAAPGHHAGPGRSEALYLQLLRWVLAHPAKTLAAGAGVLVATVLLLGQLPSGFLPKTKPVSLLAQYELPPGATLADGVRAAEALRRELHDVPDVKGVFAHDRGQAALGGLLIMLPPLGERVLPQAELERQVRERLARVPDLKTTLLLGDGAKEVNFSFVSRDPAKLEAAMDRLLAEARQLPMLTDVELSQGARVTTIDVRLLPDEAARLGVSAAVVADALRLATLSDIDSALTRVPVDGRQLMLRARLAGGPALGLEQLRQLPVATAGGGTVALGAIAVFETNSVPSSLSRLNRERQIQLQANLVGGATLGQAMEAVQALPAFKALPAEVRQAAYGEAEYMEEMFIQFAIAALAGLVAVYAVLVLLFDDWLQPLTIMVALPLSLSGAAAALLMTGHSLNLSTVIGLLMLFGIVGKNSILLVDFIVEARKAGAERLHAILDAGRDRMRPIVMTTLAMAGGMLPAALGWGNDDGFRAPMAIAVIGGLVTSTVLSLVFVPLIYQLIDSFEHRAKAWAGRLSTRGA
jgi:multidrug efflux pump subunit AcrB